MQKLVLLVGLYWKWNNPSLKFKQLLFTEGLNFLFSFHPSATIAPYGDSSNELGVYYLTLLGPPATSKLELVPSALHWATLPAI